MAVVRVGRGVPRLAIFFVHVFAEHGFVPRWVLIACYSGAA
jgi:hypothetical protein